MQPTTSKAIPKMSGFSPANVRKKEFRRCAKAVRFWKRLAQGWWRFAARTRVGIKSATDRGDWLEYKTMTPDFLEDLQIKLANALACLRVEVDRLRRLEAGL